MASFFLLLLVLSPGNVGSIGCGPVNNTDTGDNYCALGPSGKQGVCSQTCCDHTTKPEIKTIHVGPLCNNIKAQSTRNGCPRKCAEQGPLWGCKTDSGRRRRVGCQWHSKGGTSYCHCLRCPWEFPPPGLKEQKWTHTQLTGGATGEGDGHGHTQAALVGGTISCLFLMVLVVLLYFRVSQCSRKVSDQQQCIVYSEVES